MNIEKYNKKYDKITKKYCEQMYIDSIYKYDLSPFSDMLYIDEEKGIIYHNMPEITLFKKRRSAIVETLRCINYKREKNKWDAMVIVAFMSEVFDLEDITNQDYKNERIKEIEDRYNITQSRFRAQVNLFIDSVYDNKDCDHWGRRYFTIYDFIRYKYTDMDKLRKDIEENKINQKELQYIKNYYNV